MNKIQIALLIAIVGVLGLLSYSKPVIAAEGQSALVGGSEGMNYTRVQSTGAKVFDGSGVIYRVELSSGNNATVIPYALLIDTDSTGINFVEAAVDTSTIISPALIFVASAPINGQMYSFDYSPYGVRVKKGLYVYKSVANSGQAHVLNVYWKR